MKPRHALVSVIVPVYNTPLAYLSDCIESILGQSYKYVELIIVNDGSRKDVELACETLLKGRPGKVIHTSNKGVSSARNTGIADSTGEFIMFVDADDMLYDQAIEMLVATAQTSGADVVVASYTISEANAHVTGRNSTGLRPEEALLKLFYGKDISASSFAKLYAGTIVKENPFNVSISFAEDLEFNSRAFSASKNVQLVDHKIYFYRQNISGAIRSSFSLKRMDGLSALEMILADNQGDAALRRAICGRYFMEAVYVGVTILNSGHSRSGELRRCVDLIRNLRRAVINDGNAPLSWRLTALIATISPDLALRTYLYKMKFRKQL